MSPCSNFIYLECPDKSDCEGDLCYFHPHDLIRCREYRNISWRDGQMMVSNGWIWINKDNVKKWFCNECYKRLIKKRLSNYVDDTIVRKPKNE